ncbi:CDA1 [Scenedesmus sp. PABB004]|nr:CDA1 [Scenedesmus sp. PABB004]
MAARCHPQPQQHRQQRCACRAAASRARPPRGARPARQAPGGGRAAHCAAQQSQPLEQQQQQQQQQSQQQQGGAALAEAVRAVRGRFVIPADEVAALQAAAGVGMDALLLAMLGEAAHASRSAISNYKVGAVGLGGSGAVYLGANLEFPGNALNQSVHGEQFVLANLLLHRERSLHSLAISAAPCGHCRQFYSELACADSVRFVFGYRGHAEPAVFSLDQLLPARFGPLDLLEDPSAPLLLEEQRHALAWAPAAADALAARRGDAAFVAAADAALAAAQSSYAPYTRCPSGVALVTRGGAVAAGGYVESAAHNPGLPPLQAAVAAGIITGALGSYAEIQEVVVAEVGGGLVSHARAARAVAASISPDVAVTVLHVARQ